MATHSSNIAPRLWSALLTAVAQRSPSTIVRFGVNPADVGAEIVTENVSAIKLMIPNSIFDSDSDRTRS